MDGFNASTYLPHQGGCSIVVMVYFSRALIDGVENSQLGLLRITSGSRPHVL
jgi:hypothetical protein